MTLRSQSSSVLVDKVNITAISFFFGLAVHGIFEGYDDYSMRLILNLLQ
jgi:zinc transporter ZupT